MLIVVVLGVNFFLSSGDFSIGQLEMDTPDGQVLIKNFQETGRELPRKARDRIKGAFEGVGKSITTYFARKTGHQIVGVIKNLPSEQQQEIKKDYCGSEATNSSKPSTP